MTAPTKRTARPAAADQFRKLGLAPGDYTKAMQTAVKQRWSGLPVDVDMQTLRDRLAAVKPAETPSAGDLFANSEDADITMEACAAEAARLKRNASVNAWRERNQLQAAIDARGLRFARMRAGKATVTSQATASTPSVSATAPVKAGA